MTKFPPLPRLDPDQITASPLATSRWQSSESVKEALRYDENNKEDNGSIILGQIDGEIMAYGDDRHQTTFGGSRAGKGDSLVLTNLLTYKGSVICIDPKGENASVSAKWRSEVLGQKVYVLDPFRVAKVDIDRALYEFASELIKDRDGWTYLPEEEIESMIEICIMESVVPDELKQRFPVGRMIEEVTLLSPEDAARLPANDEDGLPI